MKNSFYLLEHPVLQHKLGILRDKHTTSAEVRRVMTEISTLLAYEATCHLSLRIVEVLTPMGPSKIYQIERSPLVVSVLRAGNSMLEGVLAVLTEAQVGHIGIYRDRFTLNTVEYYFKLPNRNHVENKEVLLVDPLVATGDTMLASIERLKQFNVGKITILCVLISIAAVDRIQHFYPDVSIFAVGMEKEINQQGFLIPGIGDISSRLYGWMMD